MDFINRFKNKIIVENAGNSEMKSTFLDSWVNGVSKEGVFVKDSNISNWTNDINGIPNNWIIQNK